MPSNELATHLIRHNAHIGRIRALETMNVGGVNENGYHDSDYPKSISPICRGNQVRRTGFESIELQAHGELLGQVFTMGALGLLRCSKG